MTVALKLCMGLLFWLAAVQADVSHLGYRRYQGERLRLQRLESEPAPYPAAGYRPDREFSLPHNQPLFPLANQHGNRPSGSSGFNNLGEAERPQLTYGSPQPEPRFRPQNRPQKFNNVDEPQEQIIVVRYHRRPPGGFNSFERPEQSQSNGFNSFSEEQQYESEEQTTISNQQAQSGFHNLAEPQQPQSETQKPDLLYGAPNDQEQEAQSARLKQQLIARLQQAQRFEKIQQQQQQQRAKSQRFKQSQTQILQQPQQQQQFLNAPQTLYSVPSQQLQLQAESQTSRLIARKPARLTDNREDIDIEVDANTADTEDIETTTKGQGKKTITPTGPADGVTPVVANTGVVGYYPASAVGFVQPLNPAAGPYITAANYPTLQPFQAAYTLGAPYLPQQYAFAAAPVAPAAQLKAW